MNKISISKLVCILLFTITLSPLKSKDKKLATYFYVDFVAEVQGKLSRERGEEKENENLLKDFLVKSFAFWLADKKFNSDQEVLLVRKTFFMFDKSGGKKLIVDRLMEFRNPKNSLSERQLAAYLEISNFPIEEKNFLDEHSFKKLAVDFANEFIPEEE